MSLARRRDFVELLAGTFVSLLTASISANGQHPLIAILSGTSPVFASSLLAAFTGQMRVHGRVEGRDYDVALHFADGDLSRLPVLANELVGSRPDIVVAANTTAAIAVRNATSIIPIVSVALIEPVQKGLIGSYSHPGGNLTRILISLDTLLGKQLEIATELLPELRKWGYSSMFNRPPAPCNEWM